MSHPTADGSPVTYDFDRFLRYDEMVAWLHTLAAAHPDLVELSVYGRSNEGRELWLVSVTDSVTGTAASKPAHWVDANIHSVEVTGGVAALHLLHHLTARRDDPAVAEMLRTRTMYVAPRVNPDGVEAALADRPRQHRSSTRPWPRADGHRWPGLHPADIDGDGRIRTMRIADEHGAWIEHADDPRVMIPVPVDGIADGRSRYRLLTEGDIIDHDGFTIPTPRDPSGLDLNRNFPAGWSTAVTGSGDHPLSEPEIDALVRAVRARPNICGYNAFHTFGGVLLRPSSTRSDADLPPVDLDVWKRFAATGETLTGYRTHSVFEDFTRDRSDLMSGAADDWAYEHLGVYSWTTEFWDVIHAATGERASTHIWWDGPTPEQELAVARWCDTHLPEGYTGWRPFDHPVLGPVEIGGCDDFAVWNNPPPRLLRDEVAGHAAFAVHQALASPRLDIVLLEQRGVGDAIEIRVGIANTGWLPTDVSVWARRHSLVAPIVATLAPSADDTAIEVLDGPRRRALGQLEGRRSAAGGARNDGTPDRALARWLVRAPIGTEIVITVEHPRAGTVSRHLTIGA
jgi:hypothetical protein